MNYYKLYLSALSCAATGATAGQDLNSTVEEEAAQAIGLADGLRLRAAPCNSDNVPMPYVDFQGVHSAMLLECEDSKT